MVAIAPFRALRFDPKKVDLRHVTSPPHDVIGAEERARLAASDPDNIVHLILPEDPDGGDPYQAAKQVLERWRQDGVMVRDEAPAFYMYEIATGPPDARRVMRGFLGRLRLDPTYESVRRHEKTLKGKKRDRLDLQSAIDCNAEPIWMLYRDERGWVEEILTSNAMEELARFQDDEDHEHRLWRIDRPEAVTEIVAQFEDRTVVIADGHHRYQTALDRHAQTGRDEDGSILVCFVRDTNEGLWIEPTHRLVLADAVPDVAAALQAASVHWHVEPVPDLPRDDAEAAAYLRGLVDGDPGRCAVVTWGETGVQAHLLRLREGSEVDDGRGRLDSLAVTRVHERLLGPIGVDPEEPEAHLRYTRSAADAVARVAAEDFPLAVILAPEEVDAVLDVASQGHVMPQKATYFVPKLRSGIVLGPLDEPLPLDWQEMAGDGGKPEWRMPPLE